MITRRYKEKRKMKVHCTGNKYALSSIILNREIVKSFIFTYRIHHASRVK